jgi:hypothetical protein
MSTPYTRCAHLAAADGACRTVCRMRNLQRFPTSYPPPHQRNLRPRQQWLGAPGICSCLGTVPVLSYQSPSPTNTLKHSPCNVAVPVYPVEDGVLPSPADCGASTCDAIVDAIFGFSFAGDSLRSARALRIRPLFTPHLLPSYLSTFRAAGASTAAAPPPGLLTHSSPSPRPNFARESSRAGTGWGAGLCRPAWRPRFNSTSRSTAALTLWFSCTARCELPRTQASVCGWRGVLINLWQACAVLSHAQATPFCDCFCWG